MSLLSKDIGDVNSGVRGVVLIVRLRWGVAHRLQRAGTPTPAKSAASVLQGFSVDIAFSTVWLVLVRYPSIIP